MHSEKCEFVVAVKVLSGMMPVNKLPDHIGPK